MFTITFSNGQFFDVWAESLAEATEIATLEMSHAGSITSVSAS